MTLARGVAAALIAAVILGVVIYRAVDSGSCSSPDTALDVVAALQQNGKINYIPGQWADHTAEPQFARAELREAGRAEGSEFRCAGIVAVDYNLAYVKLLDDKAGAPGAPMHREFRIEFTPSATGEERDVRLHYRLSPR
ncbi:MAG TPA: hypothetical protein VKS60_10115 [Stellaceae bacterium]|nr:hypothetical protein [Stellaceae bacterium]